MRVLGQKEADERGEGKNVLQDESWPPKSLKWAC